MKACQFIFSYALITERKIFENTPKGIRMLKILRKIIKLGLWNKLIEINSDNKNKIIAEMIVEKKIIVIEVLRINLILFVFFSPLYKATYLKRPSLKPKEEKAINHPKIIIAKENNP